MSAVTDLFKSERGFLGLALLVAATVLAATGHMPIDQWQEFSLTVFGVYVGGKTITGVAQIVKGAPLVEAPEKQPLSTLADVARNLVELRHAPEAGGWTRTEVGVREPAPADVVSGEINAEDDSFTEGDEKTPVETPPAKTRKRRNRTEGA